MQHLDQWHEQTWEPQSTLPLPFQAPQPWKQLCLLPSLQQSYPQPGQWSQEWLKGNKEGLDMLCKVYIAKQGWSTHTRAYIPASLLYILFLRSLLLPFLSLFVLWSVCLSVYLFVSLSLSLSLSFVIPLSIFSYQSSVVILCTLIYTITIWSAYLYTGTCVNV